MSRKPRVQLEGPLWDEIVDLYINRGVSLQRLARRHGIWIPRLRAALVAAGIPIRQGITAIETEDQIASDFVYSGLDIEALMRKHGVTDKVIRRVIKQRGLKRQIEPVRTTAWERREGRTIYQQWVHRYGEDEANRRLEAFRSKCRVNSRGEGNPMFGRPPPAGAGNGWKGWYKGSFFRSLRELFFMMDVLDGIDRSDWENGERALYTISYTDPLGRMRTYHPDYVVRSQGVMYEIKPLKLQHTPTVQAKAEAACRRCEELGLRYVMVDPAIDGVRLLEAYGSGEIKWTEKTEPRFRAYYSQS